MAGAGGSRHERESVHHPRRTRGRSHRRGRSHSKADREELAPSRPARTSRTAPRRRRRRRRVGGRAGTRARSFGTRRTRARARARTGGRSSPRHGGTEHLQGGADETRRLRLHRGRQRGAHEARILREGAAHRAESAGHVRPRREGTRRRLRQRLRPGNGLRSRHEVAVHQGQLDVNRLGGRPNYDPFRKNGAIRALPAGVEGLRRPLAPRKQSRSGRRALTRGLSGARDAKEPPEKTREGGQSDLRRAGGRFDAFRPLLRQSGAV